MTSTGKEIKTLISDLKTANQTIDLLNEELRRYQESLAEAIADKNRYKTENIEARELVLNIQKQIQDKVDKALNAEKQKVKEKLEKVEQLTHDLNLEKDNNRNLNELLNEKEAVINKYKQKFRELAQENPDNIQLAEKIQDIDNFREDRIINLKQLQKLASQNQVLCNQMEDILAENRLLRNLAQVPENYGFNLEEVKLAERQKIEDYKAQVRYREKEIEELEEERARLRYRLRQMSTLFSNKPGERYKDLSPDQLYLIDQYAMNLKEGLNEVPLNDRSRELQREVDKLKGQIEILENQNFGSFEAYFDKFRDKFPQKQVGDQNELSKKSDDEIKQYLIKLMETLGAQRDQVPQAQNQPVSILSMPPTPIPGPFGNWGDIREGFSYRFNSKMSVDTHGLYNDAGFDQIGAKYEIAFLQLHNLECIRLLHQKENEYQSLVNESKELKEEIRRCLLVEDELFKNYYNEKISMNENIQEMKRKYDTAVEELAEVNAKIKIYEDSFKDITSRDPASMEAKLAHHTKRVALLDVNLIRLARKYDCLLEEEKNLREAYFKAETNNAERQEYLSEKMFNLIEWRSKASKQLEILLEFQKNSYSMDERENLLTKLELMNNRYSDILIKESEYIKKLAKKESAERELFEKKEENRGLENEIVELELELEVMKRRLEQLDPFFKKYTSVFQQIVDVIKEQKISPLSAFKMFDTNDDGKVSKNEFATAIRNMKVMLTQEEIEILFLFIDLDGTGNIEYKEFLRKLRRSGVQIRRKEDDLIFSIYKAITEVGLTLEQAFEAFDRNGDNMISKKDMMDTFVSMGRTIDNESVDYIFKVADVTGDGLINYDEFYHLFEKIVKDAKMENKRQTKLELDWKMQIMLKIDDVIHSQSLQLLDAFNMIDDNGDQKVTFEEFTEMFKQMSIPIPGNELRNLFDAIDLSHNNEVSYNELLNYMRECRRENERIKRMKFLTERTENLRNESALMAKEKEFEEMQPINEANRFKMKITLLEIREKNANQKIETLLHQLKNNEDIIAEVNAYNKDLQVSLLKTNEQYYTERQKNIELQEKANGGIPKKEADLIKLENDRLSIENVALKAANNTFRNLYQSALYQTSVLRITLEKSRVEVITFKKTIKDLQGSGDREAMIGKLYYSLMISKWNEGEINKKYDGILSEFRRAATSLQSFEEKLNYKEDEIYEIHTAFQEKTHQNEKTIAELRLKIIPTITVSRIEGLSHTVKELSAMKTDLEIVNKRLRDTNYELFLKVDAFETEKEVLETLERKLKSTYSDDMSQQLIEMSQRMRDYKLSELKSKRESAALGEKEEYYQRMTRQNLETIKGLEQDLAEWDLKFAKREEFWHKRYNEQIKIVFNKTSGEENKDPMEKGFELYKRKGANDKNNERFLADITKKNSELAVFKKQLAETEIKLTENITRIKELEEQLSKKENDFTNVNQVSAHIKSEETERLAMAAQKTIQTLQLIISDKNDENERKDKYIEKLKQEFYFQKENDAQEIKELYEKLRLNNRELLDKQKLVVRSGLHSGTPGSEDGVGFLPDVNKLLNEKDSKIESILNQLETENRMRKQKESDLIRVINENEDLKKDLQIEKEKNSMEKFKQEIETLNKLVKHKDREIKGFKDSIMKLKEEFFKTCDEKMESDKKYESLQNKLASQGGNNSQIETKLRLASKKIEEVNSKIRQADAEIEEMRVKEIQWKEKYSALKQEKDRLQDLLDKASREKKPAREKKEEVVSIEEKNISTFFKPGKDLTKKEEIPTKYKDFEEEERVKELEKEVAKLRQEKTPNLIDNNGYLQKPGSMGFKDLKELMDCIREWLKINYQVNLFASLKSNDKKKLGSIPSEAFYSELKLNGLVLKPRDQALIDKSLKDPKGQINYIDFVYQVNNMKSVETLKREDFAAPERKSILKEKPLTAFEKNAVDLLKNNITELKREKDSLEKQLANWKENALTYQNQLKNLQNRFPRENAEEGISGAQNATVILQDYKDKVFKLEEKLMALQRALTVDKENEVAGYQEEKRRLEAELKNSRLENAKVKSQLDMFLSKKLSEAELLEEIDTGKELIISNLKAKIDESRENEETLKKRLMEAESKIVELLFVKENFDSQLERYQRRVIELEDVKAFYEEGGKILAKPVKQPLKKEGFKTLKK